MVIKKYGCKNSIKYRIDEFLYENNIKKHFIFFRIHKTGPRKFGYAIRVTTGLICGFIIDNIVVGTFGLPMKFLKKFGRVWYVFRFEELPNNCILRFLTKQLL